jgi:hypothetical protein
MKKTNKSANGTSFHDTVITTTVNELVRVLGEPTYQQNTGDDKVNVEWICERENGDIITIYDWKEYRSIGKDETIEFNFGVHRKIHTLDAKDELIQLLWLLLKQ